MDIIEVEVYDYTDSVEVQLTEHNDVIDVIIGEGITHVKTDGITIQGDGITTPLSAVIPSPTLSAIQWDSNHSYVTNNGYLVDDLVWYNGHVYKCNLNNDGIIPTNNTYWTDLGPGHRLQENLVDYNDLLNQPTIPTAVSQLDNDLGFFTGDDISLVATTGSYLDLLDLPPNPTLESVLTEGNTTGGNNISISDGDYITFDNGSKVKKGTTDSGNGGVKGVSLQCSVDYELKWEAGRLYVMEQDGFTIRMVSHNFTFTPTSNDDNTKGYVVGSKWVLDNGDIYNCTDNTTGSAVWELYRVIPTTTSELTNDSGFITSGDLPVIPEQVNSDWNSTSGYSQILNKPTNVSSFTNDAGYITGFTETDPVFSAWLTANPTVSADKMMTIGRNSTGSTLYKGTVVYISGSTGNRPNFVKAQANGESTSAGTFGIVYSDIANNSEGYVVTIGTIDSLDTRTTATHPFTNDTLADGDTLYLSPTTPGYVTNVKPYAPNHLVYIGKVVKTHPTQGTIVYRIQNGYELDEIHDVSAQSPSNNDGIFYNTSTGLWEKKGITTVLGYTPVPNSRTITINGETHDLTTNQTFTVTSGLTQQQILAINTFRI